MLDIDSHVTSYPFPPDVPEFSSRVASEAPDTWEQNMQSLLLWAAEKRKHQYQKPWDAGLCLTRCITTSTDLLRHEAHGLWNKLSRQWDLMHFSIFQLYFNRPGSSLWQAASIAATPATDQRSWGFLRSKRTLAIKQTRPWPFRDFVPFFSTRPQFEYPSQWHGVSRACTLGKQFSVN